MLENNRNPLCNVDAIDTRATESKYVYAVRMPEGLPSKAMKYVKGRFEGMEWREGLKGSFQGEVWREGMKTYIVTRMCNKR